MPRSYIFYLFFRNKFFPETHSLELEEIDAIFEKGGITGGVWGSPGGRTIERDHHINSEKMSSEDEKGVA